MEAGVSGLIGGPVMSIAANVALAPSTTGNQILDFITLPAGALELPGQYIYLFAQAVIVNNANSKTIAFNWGGTGEIGAAPTGGTTACTSTGTTVTSLQIEATIMKTGASTQDLVSVTSAAGAVYAAPVIATATVTDTANIQLNLLVNAATAASDVTSVRWFAQFNL